MARESSQYGLALHALTLIAHLGRPVPSEFVATSIGTNPSWVRESLASLRDAGLLRSVRGPGGGMVLARSAESITLAHIWQATEGAGVQPAKLATTPDGRCAVGGRIVPHLDALSGRMLDAVRAELGGTTLAQWVAEVVPEGQACPTGGDQGKVNGS